MDKNHPDKHSEVNFRDWFGFILLRLSCTRLISIFPVRFFSIVGGFIGYCIFHFNKGYRKSILDNLQIAFGNKIDHKKPKEICLQNIQHIVKGFVELVYFPQFSGKRKKKLFTVEGREYLDYALSLKKGVIGVTAHIGNFVIMGAGLRLEGYPVNYLIRPLQEKRIETFVEGLREKAGAKGILTEPPDECVKESIRALRNNDFLLIPIDQSDRKGGVYTKFFNRKVATPIGPLVFARRCGSPILPIFVVRKKGDHHKIIIKRPMEIKKTGDFQSIVSDYSEKLTRIIEDYIHKYPTQWEWSYSRWDDDC